MLYIKVVNCMNVLKQTIWNEDLYTIVEKEIIKINKELKKIGIWLANKSEPTKMKCEDFAVIDIYCIWNDSEKRKCPSNQTCRSKIKSKTLNKLKIIQSMYTTAGTWNSWSCRDWWSKSVGTRWEALAGCIKKSHSRVKSNIVMEE